VSAGAGPLPLGHPADQKTARTLQHGRAAVRPPRLGRVVGWCGVAFGVIFGFSGLAEPDDRGTLVVMALAGAAFSGAGLALATSRARVSSTGIRYRNGLHQAHVPAQNVLAFNVGPGSGASPARIAYVVEPQGRAPLRLTGV
jgi:hypothetical protein